MCSDPVTRMCRSNCHSCHCCCCCVEHRKLPYRVLSGLPETTLRGALHLCRGCRFVWRRRPSWWPNYVLKTPNSNQHQAGNDPLRSLTLVACSSPPSPALLRSPSCHFTFATYILVAIYELSNSSMACAARGVQRDRHIMSYGHNMTQSLTPLPPPFPLLVQLPFSSHISL